MKFLSKTLPILKADDTLPKVTQIVEKNYNDLSDDNLSKRTFEDDDEEGIHDLADEQIHHDETEPEKFENVEEESRISRHKREIPNNRGQRQRKFCDGGGVFCALYRAIQGEPINSQLIAERREETVNPNLPRYEGPPTPW